MVWITCDCSAGKTCPQRDDQLERCTIWKDSDAIAEGIARGYERFLRDASPSKPAASDTREWARRYCVKELSNSKT